MAEPKTHDAAEVETPTIDKPLLRGWFHVGAAPLALLAGITLIVFGPTLAGRISAAIFTLTAIMLFGTSAVYHRGNWTPHTRAVLRRIDHANIFLIIAGTYTPLCVMLLDEQTQRIVLTIVWVGAILGVTFRVLWVNAPRWLYVPLYLALGWVAVGFIPQFYETGGALVVWLVAIGGLCYSVGAAIYGFKWPGKNAKYFGYHEWFHALTVVAFACHYVATAIVIVNA